ncbi:uncharacterized protein LODBEIA_P56330 [Lodderomyces beijingensis]|uniref:Zn(2)-C6 fungal-type domain-containing protein n=1 Tax=Lodderomyces beijingensis TaxID=1775926 RepID=A0ABP0ZTE3_9ASCO
MTKQEDSASFEATTGGQITSKSADLSERPGHRFKSMGKPKRQRNRTPKSCVQCSKRKIFCSKERPACSNCIKYSVGHLCTYAMPPWAEAASDGLSKKSNAVGSNVVGPNAVGPNAVGHKTMGQPSGSSCSSTATVKIEQTDEYRQLKQSNGKVIVTQRKEIDDLKRQLSVLQQLSPRNTPNQQSFSQIGSIPITVLSKISPLASTYLANKLEVLGDYRISSIANSINPSKSSYIDTYSWINLVKLDPQLTTLWYRITNLQKMYHMYKINMLNNSQQKRQTSPSPNEEQHLQPLKRKQKQKQTYNSIKSSRKINEVDFTCSLQPSPSSLVDYSKPGRQVTPAPESQHRCPVVECDFNFMAEEQPLSAPNLTPRSTMSPKPCLKLEEVKPTTTIQNSSTMKSRRLHEKIFTMWDAMVSLPRGNTKLDILQIYFLLDYYYKSNIESRSILVFYKFDIQSVFKKKFNDGIELNLSPVFDEELTNQVQTTGIFLSMLVLIIEETLHELRELVREGQLRDKDTNQQKDNDSDNKNIDNDNNNKDNQNQNIKDLCSQFEEVFPNEIPLLGLGSRHNNLLLMVQDLLAQYEGEESQKSISYCALVIILLNREIDDYRKPGSIIDTKSSFTHIFTNFLHLLLNESLEIWKDPELIDLTSHYKKRKKDLRLHFCFLWTNVVRLSNLVNLNFIPLIKHSKNLDGLLKKMYQKIEQVDSLQYHLKFLTNKTDENDLIVTLHVHYLIANVSCSLCHGTMNLGSNKLTVNHLVSLIKQCETWCQDFGVARIASKLRKFEILITLEYLRCFMTYIMMLQSEENHDSMIMASAVAPDVFHRLFHLIENLNKKDNSNVTHSKSQYLYSVITEVLTRSIQFVVGLILRVRDSPQQAPGLLKLTCDSLVMKNGEIVTPTQFISKLSGEVNSVINSLTGALFKKEQLSKLVKLWKLYSTLTKDFNYAAFHTGLPGFSNDGGAASKNAVGAASACPVLHTGNVNVQSASTTKGIPSLKQELSSCPVVGHGQYARSTAAATSHASSVSSGRVFSKCPISQITTPMNDDDETMKISTLAPPPLQAQFNRPLTAAATANTTITTTTTTTLPRSPSHASTKKQKKCPFDHTTLMRPNLYPNQIESSVRRNGNTPVGSPAASVNAYKPHTPTPLNAEVSNVPALPPLSPPPLTLPPPPPPPSQQTMPRLFTATETEKQAIGGAAAMSNELNSNNDPVQQNTGLPDLNETNLDMLIQFNDFDLDFLASENIFEHFSGDMGSIMPGAGDSAEPSLGGVGRENPGTGNGVNETLFMGEMGKFGGASTNIESFFQ